MQRTLLKPLLAWKQQPSRKPLLLDGARQTGKTYLLERLLGEHFSNVIRIDFLENPAHRDAFDGALSPDDLLANIELMTQQPFNPATDLLILDEIGECERAVTSLKYFAEQTPNYFIAASGSNIGLLDAFPVGKVEQYKLRPLTFQEFVYASKDTALIKAFDAQARSAAAHQRLMDQLTDYFFTGGMPEAVAAWYDSASQGTLDRVERITKIHADLVAGYRRDFGKYAGKVDAALIESVFNSIPIQLSRVMDDSVKRFRFKNVHDRKARYGDFETAIHWLQACHLALANYPIEGMPRAPLAAYKKENKVKLFLFDVGLLNHMLNSSYTEIKNQRYAYKGYIAENFVQQELAAAGIEPSYSWHHARAEIEFVVSTDRGDIVPVEVKSGQRTKAKSLRSYIEKYSPSKTVKLTGSAASRSLADAHVVMPLYYTHHLPKLLAADE